MTHRYNKCHLDNIPIAKTLTSDYVCLRVRRCQRINEIDKKRVSFYDHAQTFSCLSFCTPVFAKSALKLGQRVIEVQKQKLSSFFLFRNTHKYTQIDSIDLSLLDYHTPTRFKDAANPIPRVLP